MRKLIYIGILLVSFSCASKSQIKPIDQGSYIVLLKDSIAKINMSTKVLNDSIVKLNQRVVMTAAQFIEIYKYERLEKYYKICVKNPSQWVYYKGWSIRVFTNK